MAMTTESSLVYDKSRDQLVQYEDSEFILLTSHVPNYYVTINDLTHWGDYLRNVASEVGRLEYFHSYDMASVKNPSYLNPDDIKRMWAGPLFISGNYPTSTQYDIDYKNMVLNLLLAYQQGATIPTIEAVINAYTGLNITVQELFKYAFNSPIYDASYRNTLQAFIPILNLGDPSSTAYNNQLYTISHDLYNATDLAKPAHVGINLGLVIGGRDESFKPIIDEVTIVDSLPTISVGNGYVFMNNVLYQFTGSTYSPVYQPNTNDSPIPPHYWLNPSTNQWILSTTTPDPNWTSYNPVPRYSAGLRFLIDLEENPLPDLLYIAPLENTNTPNTGLASDSPIFIDPWYGLNGSVSITGSGFLATSPTVIANFSGPSGWVQASPPIYHAGSASPGSTYTIVSLGTSDFRTIGAVSNTIGESFTVSSTWPSISAAGTGTLSPTSIVVSDTQLIVGIPPGIITGPIQVIIGSASPVITAMNFMAQTAPVTHPHPGLLSPQLAKVWEIKDDNVDFLNYN